MLFGTEIFEIEILKFIQRSLTNEFMDNYMIGVSSFGNVGFFWILLIIPLLFTDKYRRTGVLMLVGMLVGYLVGNLALKPFIARPRPFMVDTAYHLLITKPTDFSCPSGHALSSFICAFMLSRKSKHFGYVAFAIAALISFSRLYLYVHYPTDILVSLILAYIIYKLVVLIYKKFFRNLDFTGLNNKNKGKYKRSRSHSHHSHHHHRHSHSHKHNTHSH